MLPNPDVSKQATRLLCFPFLNLLVGMVPRTLDNLLLDSINLEPEVVVVVAPLVDKVHDLRCGVGGSRGHHGGVDIAQSSTGCKGIGARLSTGTTADQRAGHEGGLECLVHGLLDLVGLAHGCEDVGCGGSGLTKVFAEFLSYAKKDKERRG